MTAKTAQGIITVVFPIFCLALFMIVPARAAQLNTESAVPRKATETTEETISFGDLWEGTKDAFSFLPSIFGNSSESSDVKEKQAIGDKKEKGEKITEEKNKKDEPKKTEEIPVRKIPESEQTTEEKKTEPAYRVYSAPYIPEEKPSSPEIFSDSYSKRKTATEPSLPDLSQPPPLHSGIMESFPPVRSGIGSGIPSEQQSSPVAGLIRQYFPILPIGAPPDMPPQYIPLASNRDILGDHSNVLRAVVFIHDISRNASEGLAMLTTLAGTDNETTLILAPQFLLDMDITRFLRWLPEQGRNIARWPIGRGFGWHTGEDSLASALQKGISSFTAMDLILMFLADGMTFPNLRQIVVAGHGMGADFVQRYAAIGDAPTILAKQKLPVSFLVANASSYLYFTGVRAGISGRAFGMADKDKCSSVNQYPYGLEKLNPYARRLGADTIRLRFPERQITYLFSEKIMADPYLDAGCEAMAQGKSRLERGRNYERYLKMSFGEEAERTQQFAVVQSADYDPVSLFGSYCGMAVLFGDGRCKHE